MTPTESAAANTRAADDNDEGDVVDDFCINRFSRMCYLSMIPHGPLPIKFLTNITIIEVSFTRDYTIKNFMTS